MLSSICHMTTTNAHVSIDGHLALCFHHHMTSESAACGPVSRAELSCPIEHYFAAIALWTRAWQALACFVCISFGRCSVR